MRRTFAAIVACAALVAWGSDAEARVAAPFAMDPFGMAAIPWPAELDRTELLSLDQLARPSPLWLNGWYEDREDRAEDAADAADLGLPCGLFLDREPRLTLFDDPRWWEPPAATVVATWHTDKRGEVIAYDQIPRRWDRTTDYDAYRYPIVPYPGWAAVVSGYDLDLPDELQRRGAMLRAVGHGGVDLPQALGTKVTMIELAHQIGDAKVAYVGPLFGNTVVTLHAVREGGEQRHYVLLFGHLDRAAADLRQGQALPAGELVGFVGNSESPHFVHLHLEARRLRDGVDPATLTAARVLAREVTVVTDPRNVLPMKPSLARASSCKERLRAQRRAELYGDLRLELEPMRF